MEFQWATLESGVNVEIFGKESQKDIEISKIENDLIHSMHFATPYSVILTQYLQNWCPLIRYNVPRPEAEPAILK